MVDVVDLPRYYLFGAVGDKRKEKAAQKDCMKNSILYSVIVVSLLSCSTKFPKEIDNALNNCDSQIVYLAILKSPGLRKVFPNAVFSRYYNDNTHDFLLDNEDQHKAFRKDIASHYESAPDKGAVLRILNTWCEAHAFINSLGTTDGEFPPEAVLYEDSATAYIIKNQLDTRGSGDWSSLSTHQLYDTSVDFMKLVESLSDTQKQKLFSELKAISDKKKRESQQ
jgi:hypothetical protein